MPAMSWWERGALVAAVIVVAGLAAKLVDRRLSRRTLQPEAVTRYRVLRRSVMSAIITVGVLSALLAIPQVRAVAGAILASSAIAALVLGLAAQKTLGNFVAGLLIALTQPLRIGDTVEVGGDAGVVEEIGLTYTFIRTASGVRVVFPNEKLASDTIRNSTIVSREKVAEVIVQVPLDREVATAVDLLREATAGERDPEVFLSDLRGNATITMRARAGRSRDAARRLRRWPRPGGSRSPARRGR